MKRLAAINRFVRIAKECDDNGLYAFADLFTDLMKRVARDYMDDDSYENFYQPDDSYYPTPEEEAEAAQLFGRQIATEDRPEVDTRELEMSALRDEVAELVMKPNKTVAEIERLQQVLHYLRGGRWDDYQPNPENDRLRRILQMPEELMDEHSWH